MKRRMSLVVLVASALIAALATPAFAKGPESVTITGPGIEEPIELTGFADAELVDELLRGTSLWFGVSSGSRLSVEPEGELGPAYTLTWINSGPPTDPVEERTIVQLIYPHAEVGPVILTPTQLGLVGWGSEVVGWVRGPDDLTDTLTALGVPVRAQTKSDLPVIEEPAVAPAEIGPAPAVDATAETARSHPGVSLDPGGGVKVAYLWVAALVVAGLAWVAVRRWTQPVR